MNLVKIGSNEEHRGFKYPVGCALAHNLPIINDLGKFLVEKTTEDAKICLVGRGSSGALIAGIIINSISNVRPNIEFSHVKKENESSHYESSQVSPADVYVFVDDFICSGETLVKTFNGFNKYNPLVNRFDIILTCSSKSKFDYDGGLDTDAKSLLNAAEFVTYD